jgi:hypothetical protein
MAHDKEGKQALKPHCVRAFVNRLGARFAPRLPALGGAAPDRR